MDPLQNALNLQHFIVLKNLKRNKIGLSPLKNTISIKCFASASCGQFMFVLDKISKERKMHNWKKEKKNSNSKEVTAAVARVADPGGSEQNIRIRPKKQP